MTATAEPYVGSTHVLVAEVLDALVNSQTDLNRLETLHGYRTLSLLVNIAAPETAAKYDDRVSAAIEEMSLHLCEKLRQAVPS